MDELTFGIANILQGAGGLIVACAYLPQIRQIIRTRSSADMNLSFLAGLTLGVGLMEIYAAALVAYKSAGYLFLITNTISLVMIVTLAIVVCKYQPPRT